MIKKLITFYSLVKYKTFFKSLVWNAMTTSNCHESFFCVLDFTCRTLINVLKRMRLGHFSFLYNYHYYYFFASTFLFTPFKTLSSPSSSSTYLISIERRVTPLFKGSDSYIILLRLCPYVNNSKLFNIFNIYSAVIFLNF